MRLTAWLMVMRVGHGNPSLSFGHGTAPALQLARLFQSPLAPI
jgi:hypothetical protein